MRILITLAIVLFALNLQAQFSPKNIYLFTVETGEKKVSLQDPVILTNFNATGDNDYPAFFSKNELYISARTPQDTSQFDIYKLNLPLKQVTQVTETAESEWYARPMPRSPYFGAIREDRDRYRTKRLWQFPLDLNGQGEPVFPVLRNVKSFQWLDDRHVAICIDLSPENKIEIHDVISGARQILETGVGPCIQMISKDRIALVDKEGQFSSFIKVYNTESMEEEKSIIGTLPGSDYFVMLPDGTYIQGSGSKLYSFHPDRNEGWELIADLIGYEIKNISRMALGSNNRLVIVGHN